MNSFEQDSPNPRIRRSFAHAQLGNFRAGNVPFEVASAAVEAASHTRKGQGSHFEEALSNAGMEKLAADKEVILFVDWTGGHIDRPAFGGYMVPREQAQGWEQKHSAAVAAPSDARGTYEAYNRIHGHEYTTVVLTTTSDQEAGFQWGKAYDLAENPANARLKSLKTRVHSNS